MSRKTAKRSRWAAVAGACALGIALAGCAAPQERPADEAGASEGPAIEAAFSWSAEADCASCHEAQASSLADASCQIAASHSGVACMQCHADADGLSKAHAEVTLADTKGARKLSKTKVEKDACVACHADAGAPEAAAGSTALTDDQGTTVNPHDLPASESHDTVTCGSCHAMHDGEPLEQTASDACAQCHHQGVYECYTCHE